jgi:hypothetical protein
MPLATEWLPHQYVSWRLGQTSTPSLDPEQPRPTGVAQAASQANADLGASRPSVLLVGAGLPILGLARHGPGEFTTVGGQRLADGHVPGHIGQPPGRGPGRPRNRSKAVWASAVRGHQHLLGLLDQPAMLQGGLQLAGQPPLDLGGDGGAEQAGHQPAWACRAATSPGSQSRGWPAWMSRVPITPPSNSTPAADRRLAQAAVRGG